MIISTQQELINKFYNDDDTKTISDLIEDLRIVQSGTYTTEQVQNQLKLNFPDISDWSF